MYRLRVIYSNTVSVCLFSPCILSDCLDRDSLKRSVVDYGSKRCIDYKVDRSIITFRNSKIPGFFSDRNPPDVAVLQGGIQLGLSIYGRSLIAVESVNGCFLYNYLSDLYLLCYFLCIFRFLKDYLCGNSCLSFTDSGHYALLADGQNTLVT